ncbi:hypothetical protein BFJ63_vAg16002 [Fusarium oxysporum f. sp. narcissi]|uniref:Uncharacterized protein n=2 Tax=Fusarium oxysporum TaxID=5507 RepID=A0A4Q2VAQ2_FUSOX|nr:hypothetical protein BFJ65_g17877 [Fusarium oxysporum f. sp. cepae]RKK31138.1 hypothetical protein BFJ67_g15399 [Fusarium oxysporum f. sp. cepae]RKK40190.1 hypothetical protein BFJ66_g11627 [Fusarium oxysporum f. sp. cepae]RYC81117.1 hypothetical protein BFJ63_vAg16002 [Fusarium oxysporum f. sp. narcissi]
MQLKHLHLASQPKSVVITTLKQAVWVLNWRAAHFDIGQSVSL